MDTRHQRQRSLMEQRKGVVVEMLRTQSLTVHEIHTLTGFRLSTVSHYLSVLAAAGWLASCGTHRSRLRRYHTSREQVYPAPAKLVTPALGYQRKVPEEKPLTGGRIIRFDGKDAPNHYPERRFEYKVKQESVHIAVSPIYDLI